MLALDGSTLEGGGQLVRVALSLSAICEIPISIHNIRANRARKGKMSRFKTEQPRRNERRNEPRSDKHKSQSTTDTSGGLKESHLAALNWLADHCDADVDGGQVGSTEITFTPRHRNTVHQSVRQSDETHVSTIQLKNPGSVWLVFQAIYPYIVFNGHRISQVSSCDTLTLHLHGGTHVPKSMSTHYLTKVFQPTCQRIGLPEFKITTHSHGWAGSAPAIGHVEITIPTSQQSMTEPDTLVSQGITRTTTTQTPFRLSPFTLSDRGTITKITAHILAEPASVRHHIQQKLTTLIPQHMNSSQSIALNLTDCESSLDNRRLYILLVAHTSNGYVLGRDFLGGGRRPRNDSEALRLAEQACESVVRHLAREVKHGGCVDEFMADQVVIFQALASGRSIVDGSSTVENVLPSEVDRDEKNLAALGSGVEKLNVDDVEMSGDDSGSLHARTVRWVAESMLKPRYLSSSLGSADMKQRAVKFHTGGVCDGIGWNSN